MKQLICLCLLFFALNSFSQNYYTVNWTKTPENPIPVKFTPNHFGLNGKVKMMVTRSPFINEITAFDDKGLCKGIKRITQSDTFETIFYYNLPSTFVIKATGKFTTPITAYTLKFTNTIVESIPANDKGEPDTRLKMLYDYNNRGLFEALNPAGEYNPELRYQYFYNEAKQLIKKREHQEFKFMNTISKKEISTTVYEYKSEGNNLQVTITKSENDAKKIIGSIKRVYNHLGLITYETKTEYGFTDITAITYIMDAQNNWTTRTETDMTEGSENKDKPIVTARIIQYY